jgi:hypothetical protein
MRGMQKERMNCCSCEILSYFVLCCGTGTGVLVSVIKYYNIVTVALTQ